MNKWIVGVGASVFLFSGWAMAETHTFKVKGMHCTGCVESVEGEVCEAGKYKACKVGLVKGEKNVGEISIETNPGQTLVLADIQAKVKNAGDDYVVNEVKGKQTKKK